MKVQTFANKHLDRNKYFGMYKKNLGFPPYMDTQEQT